MQALTSLANISKPIYNLYKILSLPVTVVALHGVVLLSSHHAWYHGHSCCAIWCHGHGRCHCAAGVVVAVGVVTLYGVVIVVGIVVALCGVAVTAVALCSVVVVVGVVALHVVSQSWLLRHVLWSW